MLSKPLASILYYNFQVIVTTQCGIDINKEKTKLFLVEYIKSFLVNFIIQFLPSN